MPNDGTYGRKLVSDAVATIHKLGAELRVLAESRQLPDDYRREAYGAKTREIRDSAIQAFRQLDGWADLAQREARRKMLGTEPPDPGVEARIQRLVATGRGKPGAGDDLARRADEAYYLGDFANARTLATAALALDPSWAGRKLADETVRLVDYEEASADPARAAGLRELDDVKFVVALANRDVNAIASRSLRDGLAVLESIGERQGRPVTDQAVRQESVKASIAAKLAAYSMAAKDGDGYPEPGAYHEPPALAHDAPENPGATPDRPFGPGGPK